MIYELIIGGGDRDGRYYWWINGNSSERQLLCWQKIFWCFWVHHLRSSAPTCSFGGMEVEEASPARQATVEPKRYQFRHLQSVVDSLLSHIYFIAVEFVPRSTRNAKSDSQLLSGLFSGSHWQQVYHRWERLQNGCPLGRWRGKGNDMRFRIGLLKLNSTSGRHVTINEKIPDPKVFSSLSVPVLKSEKEEEWGFRIGLVGNSHECCFSRKLCFPNGRPTVIGGRSAHIK